MIEDWVSGEIMQKAQRLRMAAAASGLRAPLAVTTDADPMPAARHQVRVDEVDRPIYRGLQRSAPPRRHMYGKNDLRASLAPNAASDAPAVRTPFKPATYARFYEDPPASNDANGRAWYSRGQNMIVNYILAQTGRTVLPRRATRRIRAADPGSRHASGDHAPRVKSRSVTGPAVVFIPPGDSSIEARSDGALLRLLTTRAADLLPKCPNNGDYAEQDPNVPAFEAWPEPVGGYRIRAYPGDVPGQQGRFGRLYRGSTIMVNFGDGRVGKRNPREVSPHHHDDFEQYSIALAGEFIHHLRWPWTSDSTTWREDEHERCASPSVTVIPPPATHTSVGATDGLNRLCDAFCPPRFDFSRREGWVLNAADYPMPATANKIRVIGEGDSNAGTDDRQAAGRRHRPALSQRAIGDAASAQSRRGDS